MGASLSDSLRPARMAVGFLLLARCVSSVVLLEEGRGSGPVVQYWCSVCGGKKEMVRRPTPPQCDDPSHSAKRMVELPDDSGRGAGE
jgi:hypothetical protein